MNEPTKRVLAWYRNEPEAQSQANGVPNMPLAERGRMLRTAADKARTQLMGIDFDDVDWEAAVRSLDSQTESLRQKG